MTEKVKQAYNALSLRKRLVLIAAFSLIVLTIAGTAAIGVVSGFSNQIPVNQSTVTTATPKISAHLSNSGGTYDISNISMTIDNTPFKPTVSGTSPEYDITYTPTTPLSDGVHSVFISVPDSANPETPYSTNWSFNVAAPPVLSSFYPINNTITNRTPEISAIAKDNTGIQSAILQIDGQAYSPQIDQITGKISFTPSIPLLDGTHTVNLTVYDLNSNVSTKQWNFTVHANGPSLYLSPGNNAIVNSAYANAHQLLVVASDATTIDQNSVQLFINNNPTAFTFSYEQDADGLFNYKRAYIYGPFLTDGNYTARVVVKDRLGNVSEQTWQFTIAIPPLISNITPKDKTVINTSEVDISADIADPNGPAIDQNNTKLTLDGVEQTFTYTPTDSLKGKLTSKVTGLQPEKYNTLTLVVSDTKGNKTTATWQLYYNQFGDMSINATDCGSCHTLNEYKKYVHSRGPDIETTGGTAGHSQTGTCGHCHVATYTPEKCDYCHNGAPWDVYGGVVAANPSLQANRNCLDCHDVTGPMVKKVNNSAAPAPAGTIHDILPLHQSNNGDCASCHSSILTRTHNGKKDSTGNQINCATCHKSTNPKVKDAITNHKKDCLDCHDLASNHEAVHTDTLDDKCLKCHKSTISAEHTSNTITQKTQLNCHTCHGSTRLDVSSAIANNIKDCSACHDNAHGLPLSGTLPADVPTNPSYNWTAPIKGAIFSGETWFPAEYKDGNIIISNRRTDINGDQVWNYYSTQMQSLGWALASDAPTTGITYFKVNFTKLDSFTKVTRKATIWFYGGDNHNEAPVSTTGSRIEIFYN